MSQNRHGENMGQQQNYISKTQYYINQWFVFMFIYSKMNLYIKSLKPLQIENESR